MAKHLISKGHELSVLDMNPEPVAALKKLGAKVSKTPAEAAADSEFVITMLPACPHVTEVFTGKDGILK